ncbi:MAG: transporter substrate-binding domain-containing protein [Shewanella sp.]|nr:transporter substrate-binding domain-containing protein [Shewanella sp.]
MKPHFLIVLCVFFSFLSFDAHPEEAPLVIAVSTESFPYQYKTEQGKPSGLLVDLWKEWGKENDRNVKFILLDWQQSLDAIKNGVADIHAGMANTRERESHFSFASPIATVTTHLYLNQSLVNKNKIEQLVPYQIGVVEGSAHKAKLNRFGVNFSYKEFVSRSVLLNAAMKGDILVFAGMEGYLRKREREESVTNLYPLESRLTISEINLHPAVKVGNDTLLKEIESGFNRISDERIEQIQQHWLGNESRASGISIALNKNNSPYSELGVDGLPHGMVVDIWRLWGQKVGKNVNFIFSDDDEAREALKNGQVEIALSNSRSEDLPDDLTNSWKLFNVKHRFFAYKTPVKKLSELNRLSVGVLNSISYAAAIKRQFPQIIIKEFNSIQDMIESSTNGEIRGFIAPAAWAQHKLLQQKAWADFFQDSNVEYTTTVHSLIQTKNIGLNHSINDGFNKISHKELAVLEDKWILNPADHVFIETETSLPLSIEQQDYLNKLNPLKFGYLQNWAPMEFTNESGLFSGINSEIVDLIKQQLKLNVEPIRFNDWQSLYSALQDGEIDFAGSMASSETRQESIIFTRPYWPSSWALVSSIEHAGLFRLDQLSELRIAVVEGYDLSSKIMLVEPNIKLILVSDSEAGVEAVASDNADIFIDKLMTLSHLINQSEHYNLNISLLPELGAQQSHFGFHPRFKLLVPLVDNALRQVTQVKKQALYKRWIPKAITNHNHEYRNWLIYVSIAFAISALSFFIYWLSNKRLQKEVARRQKIEQRIQYLNSHDNLTGLLNRRLLDDRLTSAVLTHSREQTRFAVMFVSLDNFKLVNDTRGYNSGDELLIGCANALAGTIRRSDTLARFGGDEFVVILNRAQEFDAVCQVAENALAAIARVVEAKIPEVNITASIGVAFYPMDADSPIELLKQADKLTELTKGNDENSYMTS